MTEADIDEFEANYRGSDSEKKDLIDMYKKCKGNMKRYNCIFVSDVSLNNTTSVLIEVSLFRLFCFMICSDPKLDSHRFKDILDERIAAGKILVPCFSFNKVFYVICVS